MGHSGDGSVLASTLCKYDLRKYPCMLCVALLMCLFVLCVACL